MNATPSPITLPARLWFLGRRGYVHGTTVFELFLTAAARAAAAWELAEVSPEVAQFKLTKEIGHHGQVEVWSEEAFPPERPAPSASLQGSLAGLPVLVGLWEDEAQPVQERRPEAMSALVAAADLEGDFSGKVELTGIASPAQLVTGIIAANKALHLATLGAGSDQMAVRWLYMQGLPALSTPSTPRGATLRAKLAQRMKHGAELFTVSVFSGNFAEIDFATKICFGCKPV